MIKIEVTGTLPDTKQLIDHFEYNCPFKSINSIKCSDSYHNCHVCLANYITVNIENCCKYCSHHVVCSIKAESIKECEHYIEKEN